jgi:GNAT superfamily N-acetyltransferase
VNPLRPTTPADTDALVALTEATGLFRPIEVQALREVLDDYHATNRDHGHHCISCDEADRVAGFAYYAPAAMTERAWHLWWIVVRKDVQAHGRGSLMLRYLEDDIRRRQGRVLFIETGSLPHYELTRRFYLKHDYEQHAILKDYYAPGESMVVFRKEL